MFTGIHRTRLATVTLGAAAIGTLGAPAAVSITPPNQTAYQAVSTLTTRSPDVAARHVPTDFDDRFGYRPQVRDGLLARPDGTCSSPVPLPDEFTAACRRHDYGYDLLRYAERSDAPLPPAARRMLDTQFTEQAHAACRQRTSTFGRTTCSAWATIAGGALRLNSWRQHDGAPSPETPRSIAAGGGLAVAGAGALTLGVLALRREGGR